MRKKDENNNSEKKKKQDSTSKPKKTSTSSKTSKSTNKTTSKSTKKKKETEVKSESVPMKEEVMELLKGFMGENKKKDDNHQKIIYPEVVLECFVSYLIASPYKYPKKWIKGVIDNNVEKLEKIRLSTITAFTKIYNHQGPKAMEDHLPEIEKIVEDAINSLLNATINREQRNLLFICDIVKLAKFTNGKFVGFFGEPNPFYSPVFEGMVRSFSRGLFDPINKNCPKSGYLACITFTVVEKNKPVAVYARMDYNQPIERITFTTEDDHDSFDDGDDGIDDESY